MGKGMASLGSPRTVQEITVPRGDTGRTVPLSFPQTEYAQGCALLGLLSYQQGLMGLTLALGRRKGEMQNLMIIFLTGGQKGC